MQVQYHETKANHFAMLFQEVLWSVRKVAVGSLRMTHEVASREARSDWLGEEGKGHVEVEKCVSVAMFLGWSLQTQGCLFQAL